MKNNKLNIVHLVSADRGGAYRAAFRLNQALNEDGVNSRIIVVEKKGEDQNVLPYFKNNFMLLIFKILRRISVTRVRKFNLSSILYESNFGLPLWKFTDILNADIIHLHWINDGMLSNQGLEKICHLDKPVVWTMHDMFSFTAGCYYDNSCGGYKLGCNKCKLAGNNSDLDNYIKKLYSEKEKVYDNTDINFVGCSRWITECAKMSSLCKNKKVINIPNPVNTMTFKAINKEEAKKRLGINTSKNIILFGAIASDSDWRKGYKYLKQALEYLNPKEYLAMVFGNSNKIDIDMENISMGIINDDREVSLLYSAADVFVAPSIQENLSNTVLESLSCGTPVVAFDIGGMSDMIKDGETGYLAKAFDTKEMALLIEKAIEKNKTFQCREFIKENFSYSQISKSYINLYNELKH